jgi:hypothetical protein
LTGPEVRKEVGCEIRKRRARWICPAFIPLSVTTPDLNILGITSAGSLSPPTTPFLATSNLQSHSKKDSIEKNPT